MLVKYLLVVLLKMYYQLQMDRLQFLRLVPYYTIYLSHNFYWLICILFYTNFRLRQLFFHWCFLHTFNFVHILQHLIVLVPFQQPICLAELEKSAHMLSSSLSTVSKVNNNQFTLKIVSSKLLLSLFINGFPSTLFSIQNNIVFLEHTFFQCYFHVSDFDTKISNGLIRFLNSIQSSHTELLFQRLPCIPSPLLYKCSVSFFKYYINIFNSWI